MRRSWIAIAVLCATLPLTWAQNAHVDEKKQILVRAELGSDAEVDYASLLEIGPWDDRNYKLTKEDLAVLSENEAELGDPIPVFFRVAMRKAWPSLPRTGSAQYPRSALQIFKQFYGGYLVDGKLYRGVRRVGKRFAIVREQGVPLESFEATGDFVSGEVRLTNPNGAAESAIKVSPTDTNKVVAGTNGPNGGQKMHYSSDGGDTWQMVDLPLGGTCCDPAVDWSSDGQYAYATALGNCFFTGCGVWFYRSNDGGQTWTNLETLTPGDPRREVALGGSDKEYLHVDKSSASPHKDNIYVTWHQSNRMWFAVSKDFGNTFSKQQLPNDSPNLGIGSDITTNKAGDIFYVWPGTQSRTIRFVKSTNGGDSFTAPAVIANTQASFDFPIPSMDTREVFVYAAVDADLSNGTYGDSIYAAWTDSTGPTGVVENNHARIQVGYSRDGGQSWSVTTPHETSDQNTVDRWHPWLTVGPDGTVHVVFYDTRRASQRDAVDLFYAYSTDGAQTWSDPERVTTTLSAKIEDGFEFGDYNGLDIVMNELIAIFTDNRDETGGSAESVDVYVAGIDPGTGAVCGNGNIDPSEVCDGGALGGQTCTSQGCTGGVLSCASDCGAFDLSTCTGCPGTGAGRIPGSRGVAGTPFRVLKSGNDLALSWSASCVANDDYAIYEGSMSNFTAVSPATCSTAGQTSRTITSTSGSRFFVVVPVRGSVEGSYGRRSDGNERAVSGAPCHPQQIEECP